MKYARIDSGRVMEVIDEHPDGHPIEECFHPSVLQTLVPIPDGLSVDQHWLYIEGRFVKGDSNV